MKIIFFDGYCSLCNAFIEWLIRHDHQKKLRMASLQGETAQKLLPQTLVVSLQAGDPDSVVYLRDGEILDRSTAVLRIFEDVGGIWVLMKIFFLFPRFLRDLVYVLIAQNRYRLFGKKDSCRIPTSAERERLLP